MASLEWGKMQPAVILRMRECLGSDFQSFQEVCESIGLLSSNFLSLNRHMKKPGDECFVCSMCSSVVVSAANHYGNLGELELARYLCVWALKLEPSQLAAMLSLATLCELEGDLAGSQVWRDKMQTRLKELVALPEGSHTPFEIGVLRTMKKAM